MARLLKALYLIFNEFFLKRVLKQCFAFLLKLILSGMQSSIYGMSPVFYGFRQGVGLQSGT